MPRVRIPGLLLGIALISVHATRADDFTQVRMEATRLLDEGSSAYNRGEFGVAVAALQKAAKMALNSFRVHYYLGLALIGDRRPAEAVDILDIALDLEPANAQAHVAMGNARLRQGDPDEAAASFVRALKVRAEYPQALDGLAQVYDAQGDTDRSVQFYRRAIASNKGYAEAYANLGKLYLREGRLGEAIALLREAVTIRADFAYGYNGLAEAYSRIGLQGDALIAVRKAIELDPKAPDHLATLGDIELEMELIDRAEASFKRALNLDPGYPDARLGLAEVARRRADYETAAREIDAALGDPRTDALARTRLEARRDAVAKEGAESAELTTLFDSGVAPPEATHRLAAIHAARHEWKRAAELQGGVPADGIERERLAYYQLKAGNRREALELYTTLAKGTGRADLEVNTGVALAGLGNDRSAIEAYGRALAIDAQNPRARLYYANSLVRLGRYEEAAERYRKYLTEHPDGAAAERVKKILDRITAAQAAPAPAAAAGGKP